MRHLGLAACKRPLERCTKRGVLWPVLTCKPSPSFSGEFAGRSSLHWGNPYRAKAYARAADSLSALVVPLAQIVDAGRLTEIPGIGDAIADIVTKLHRTGTHPSLEAMRKEIPAGVL
jgi:DNA polymerase (family X)